MFTIWGENHDFNPSGFLNFLEQSLLYHIERSWSSGINGSPIDFSDCDNTFVVSDSEVLECVIIDNAS